eukprot:UN28379
MAESRKEVRAEDIDLILEGIEVCLQQWDVSQHSAVRARKVELDICGKFEAARDFVQQLLQSGDRAVLKEIFGDCTRAARLRALLVVVSNSAMNTQDQRITSCDGVCRSLEEILNKEFGLASQLVDVVKSSANVCSSYGRVPSWTQRKTAALVSQIKIDDDEKKAGDEPDEEDGEDEDDEEVEGGSVGGEL